MQKVEFPLCRGDRDSLEFWIPRRGFRISRHWILVVSRIQDFLELYSGFQSPGFLILQAIFFSGFQIPRTEKFPDSFSWGDRILIKKAEG